MLRNILAMAVLSASLVFTGCGSGVAPSTSATTPSALTISPAALAFPSTAVGQTSAPLSFTLTNSGGTTLTLGGYTATGATSSFTLQTSGTTCTASIQLAANASCTFAFAFNPQLDGTLSETITLTDNNGGITGSTQTLTLSGTGTGTVNPPTATLSPNPLTFPNTGAGSPSVPLSANLANTGASALAITSSGIITGSGASAFAITANNCGTSLGPTLICNISITFTPATASTTYTATLTVTDNSGGIAGSTQTVTLTGTGSAPVPTALAVFSPTSLTFANTNVGITTASQTVTLSNPGTGTLTGIVFASSGNYSAGASGGSSTTVFPFTTNCTATLAAGSSCTLQVSFVPPVGAAWTGALTAADSAANTPQAVTITGTGEQANAQLNLNYINFPLTQDGTTSASQSVTVTNNGNATLTGIALSLSGTNAANFAYTTTCGVTLAAGSVCSISGTFSPTLAGTDTATINFASSATSTPQTIALTGTGTSSATVHTLYVFGPGNYTTPTPLYTLILGAQKTVDMTMYELEDTVFSSDLIADCARGVTVRVLLDASVEKTANTAAYTQLNTAGPNCSAVFSNTVFQATHQDSITVDYALSNATTAIMSLNLVSLNYAYDRDFAMVENDPLDIAAIESAFDVDFASGTPYGGSQGGNDFNYVPGTGDTSVIPAGDLIWSPVLSGEQNPMLNLIAGAGATLIVENEDMSATNVVNSIAADCLRGVKVEIVMSNDSTTAPYSSYSTNLKQLETYCGASNIRTYADATTGLTIHANAAIADFGTTSQFAYIGSVNYSTNSMTESRELGIYVSDTPSVTLLNTTMAADYAGATPF